MSNINPLEDSLNLEKHDNNPLPSMLNVLTILTFVGSAFGLIMALISHFTICKSVAQFENIDTSDMGSGALSKLMTSAMELATKQCDNRVVILIVTIVTIALCVLGAMLMRSLKKQGFIIYALGELLYPIATFFILGSSAMGGMLLLTGFFLPIVFVILYATQYKQLKH